MIQPPPDMNAFGEGKRNEGNRQNAPECTTVHKPGPRGGPCNGMQHNATLFAYFPRAGRQGGLLPPPH